jgi:GNAT superfamily N-acetyltransferase
MYKLKQTNELAVVREMFAYDFSNCDFPEDHTFWLAVDQVSKLAVGFASAVYRPDSGYVYLGSCWVHPGARGHKLQRRFLRARVAWARRKGADRVVTYTVLQNYASMVNLLACGFEFYRPGRKYVGDDVHYFRRKL